MHRGKDDPGVSELPQGSELSRDHVNRPLVLKFSSVLEDTAPGGSLQLRLYGGVWPYYWKIEPFTD